MRNKKINKRQFTLIELIIVIVVIGILAAMALPKFLGVQRNAKVAAMETDLDVIEKAVMQYVTATDDGSYPFIDVNGDKVINEQDLYFKTDNAPQTLKDALLKASGDDGSKIYKLDMNKLKPYISKIKYPDTEYLYSEKSDTAIDPVGKADGDNFIHHIIGSGITNSETSENPISRQIKQHVKSTILFNDGEMIQFLSHNNQFELVSNENSNVIENVQRLYEGSEGFYMKNNKLHFENYELKLETPLTIKDEVYFIGVDTGDSAAYLGFILKENGTLFFEHNDGDSVMSNELEYKLNSNDKFYFNDYMINGNFSIIREKSIETYSIDDGSVVTKNYDNGIKYFYLYGDDSLVVSNNNEVYFNGIKTSHILKDDQFFNKKSCMFVNTKNQVVDFSSYYGRLDIQYTLNEGEKLYSDGYNAFVLKPSGELDSLDPLIYTEDYKLNPTDTILSDGFSCIVKKEDGTLDILDNQLTSIYGEYLKEELEHLNKFEKEKNPIVSFNLGSYFIIYKDDVVFVDSNVLR